MFKSILTLILVLFVSFGFPQSNIEQNSIGKKEAAKIIYTFDGLGVGFKGPQGEVSLRNPSDNSLAVGPDHVVQIVNSHMAIFSKKGEKFNQTGKVLYGPVQTRNVFKGFGGPCDSLNNGDAVVRYDQLADRWLIVMPIFRRVNTRQVAQPGEAKVLYQPTAEEQVKANEESRKIRQTPGPQEGDFCMCYAISTTSDPLGSYYRYEFYRPLFPDYPRPAVWPDGYYLPTSTGDDVIEKHACVVDRNKMLKGEPAKEQCLIVKDVNFLNNADLDGKQLPPDGSPNIVLATGGSQLNGVVKDDGIYAWNFHVDWEDPDNTRLEGPKKIQVAPYHYLCDGQLTNCVPQPGTDQRLDSQGDKIMARLVYRRINNQESLVAVHSVNTRNGMGGVRWYEFRLDGKRDLNLYQQGTFNPDNHYRWMASPAIDKFGNIGIGYSYGGSDVFVGQRFSGRNINDPKGKLTFKESILVEGESVQTNTLRWEDYTQTAVDPSDDCTIWYVGDYIKRGASSYSTKIGAFQMPGCGN